MPPLGCISPAAGGTPASTMPHPCGTARGSPGHRRSGCARPRLDTGGCPPCQPTGPAHPVHRRGRTPVRRPRLGVSRWPGGAPGPRAPESRRSARSGAGPERLGHRCASGASQAASPGPGGRRRLGCRPLPPLQTARMAGQRSGHGPPPLPRVRAGIPHGTPDTPAHRAPSGAWHKRPGGVYPR